MNGGEITVFGQASIGLFSYPTKLTKFSLWRFNIDIKLARQSMEEKLMLLYRRENKLCCCTIEKTTKCLGMKGRNKTVFGPLLSMDFSPIQGSFWEENVKMQVCLYPNNYLSFQICHIE